MSGLLHLQRPVPVNAFLYQRQLFQQEVDWLGLYKYTRRQRGGTHSLPTPNPDITRIPNRIHTLPIIIPILIMRFIVNNRPDLIAAPRSRRVHDLNRLPPPSTVPPGDWRIGRIVRVPGLACIQSKPCAIAEEVVRQGQWSAPEPLVCWVDCH